MTLTVFLTRHGETNFNAQDRIQGSKNSRLTERGKAQAKSLGRAFADKKIDVVISSPYLRTKQTAKIAFPAHAIQFDSDLRERGFGVWEGKKWPDLAARFPDEYAVYRSTRILTVKDAESLESVQQRSRRLLERIVEAFEGKTIVLVGHGMLNKVLLSQALGWNNEFMAAQHQAHANISELEWNGKKWHLKTHRSTAHLNAVELPLRDIAFAVKEWEDKTNFKSHDFLHVTRVAMGAKWFAAQLGQSSHEQDLAYVAGLLHDLGRPKTEKIDHTQTSVQLAAKMLANFSISAKDQQQILELIAMHRTGQTALPQQVVFLADKLWEQSGAYATFRRAVFVAEVADFAGKDPIDAFIEQHTARTKKFYPALFPAPFQGLAQYQFEWVQEVTDALTRKEPWISELILHCYKKARQPSQTIDNIIKTFKPTFSEGKRFQQEAILYITGRLENKFTELVSK